MLDIGVRMIIDFKLYVLYYFYSMQSIYNAYPEKVIVGMVGRKL